MTKDLEEVANKRVQKLLEITQKVIGEERALLGNNPKLHMGTVPTGIAELDQILGHGGFRRGRMAMVIGDASMGKTLITQWVIRAFQGQGLTCGFIDPEHTYDEEWFSATGINTSDLIVVRPTSTEETFDLSTTWAKAGMDLIVIDSLAALEAKARAESTLEEKEFMGRDPFKIGEGLKHFTNANWDSFMVCTNQLRSKIGVVYGSPDEIPGGRAQKFYSSYILRVKRAGFIEEPIKGGKKKVGYKLGIETIKNKLAPPFQTCEIPFLYTGIIDTVASVVDLALDLDLIPKKGGGYYFWDSTAFQGLVKLKTYLADNPDALDRLQTAISEADAVPDFDAIEIE